MIAIVLMSFGGLVFLSGFLLFQKSGKEEMGKKELNKVIEIAIADGILTKNEKIKIGQLAEKNNLDFDSVILDAENKLQLLGINSETELIDYNAKNGYDFEKYIVQRFNKKFYKIKSWAGDKYVGGQYAESNMEPDILFELNLGRDSSQFYVECKWRKQYYKNGIEFATEKQFERYNLAIDMFRDALKDMSAKPGETAESLADRLERLLKEKFEGKKE